MSSMPLPPRTHLTNPHAAAVYGIMSQFFKEAASLGSNAMSLTAYDSPSSKNPGWMRDFQLRLKNPHSLNPMVAVGSVYIKSMEPPAPYPPLAYYCAIDKAVMVLRQTFAADRDKMYPVGNVPFNTLLELLIRRLRAVEGYCLASVGLDFSHLRDGEPLADDRELDMCSIKLVLKDEIEPNGDHDFYFVITIAGPRKIQYIFDLIEKA